MKRRRSYRRIVLKLSGELMGLGTESFNFKIINHIVRQVGAVVKKGVRVALVVGGGNIIRGKTSHEIDRIDADICGMMATVVNGMVLHSLFKKQRIKSVLRSAIEIPGIAPRVNRSEDKDLYESGVVIIYVAGTGNPLFTTDTSAALRAAELDADVLIKGTKVRGIFSDDPEKNNRARFYERVTHAEAIEKRLKVMDAAAFTICHETNMPIYVFDFMKYPLSRVVAGDKVGTLVTNGG
ncbi:MAG TPA: UMP kinase [bacterium]